MHQWACKAQALHGAFEGLALERALSWSEPQPAGFLTFPQMAGLGEPRTAALDAGVNRGRRQAFFPRGRWWAGSGSGPDTPQTPEDTFPPN